MTESSTASEQITREVTSWPGVEAGPGRRGEFAFRVGRREIGHLHGDLGQIVAELETFGFVEQLPDPTDARAKLVRYTPAGRRGYQLAMKAFTDLEREQVARVGAARVSALKQDLRLLAAIDDPPD